MVPTLLTTKLYVPPPCPALVKRPRLTLDLSKALTRRLTLVSAPAGYGKTTLVSSWLRETDIASAWLSLDEGDNDPIRFLQYFLSALHQIVPAVQLDLLDMLRGMRPAQADALLNCLINAVAENAVSFVLVLDDFHVIHAQPILEMLAFLLDHLPPQLHLVCLSRTDPDLPLARLRVHDQLVDIRAEQLRFTLDEIAVFLSRMLGLNLVVNDLAALETRTEGWIAGLQLTALSLQGRQDIHGFVAAFTGSHAYIMDYLTEEVLQLQPEHVRSFLLQTSILDRLCVPLCEAVVETDQTAPLQGRAMLEALERMNLFVIPLDDERRWYRYHHLFADVLNRRLEHLFPQRLADLHRRASCWYEQNGFIAEATHHALIAGDPDRAAELIVQHGRSLLMSGEVITLLNLIEAVESQTPAHPWLAVQKAWGLTLTGRLDQAERMLDTAEQLIAAQPPTSEARSLLGCVAAGRAHRANLQGETCRAADFARQALAQLPNDDPLSQTIRSVTTSILGDASWLTGNLEEARQAYLEAVRIGQAANDVRLVVMANSTLADVLMAQGQLHKAARLYSESLQMATYPDGRKLPLADRAYAGLSRVSYEWNQLAASARYAHQCLELCQPGENIDLQALVQVVLAKMEHAQGNWAQAQVTLRAAERLASEYPLSSRQSIWVESALTCIWLAQGDQERAVDFVQRRNLTLDDGIPYLREPEYLVLLRLRLAQGDHAAALTLAGRLLQQAETANRTGDIIERLILQALIFQAKKELDLALTSLRRAFALAQREGYVRVFLDEGEPMAKLLYQAKAHQMGTSYAAELLPMLSRANDRELPPAQLLIEPLSSRELEVLTLIESGHSNQAIAAQLVISITTVKRHISNIYAKLGVTSRTQAVACTRELQLFKQ
jgi:LuxR family transcriptional regulator, maltose regulon positive regulatory protein